MNVNRTGGRSDGQSRDSQGQDRQNWKEQNEDRAIAGTQGLSGGAERYRNYASRPRRANASSRYRGVSFRRRTGLWIAQVYWRGKRYYLGSFRSEVEAARAYNRHAHTIIGSLALLNEIPDASGYSRAA